MIHPFPMSYEKSLAELGIGTKARECYSGALSTCPAVELFLSPLITLCWFFFLLLPNIFTIGLRLEHF